MKNLKAKEKDKYIIVVQSYGDGIDMLLKTQGGKARIL